VIKGAYLLVAVRIGNVTKLEDKVEFREILAQPCHDGLILLNLVDRIKVGKCHQCEGEGAYKNRR